MMRTWEGERPVPPPATDAGVGATASRRRASRTRALAREATGGKIDAFHLTDVDGPQECLAILDQTFVNPGLLWTMSVGGYLDYLLHTADLQEAYEYHARVLKLLQWGCARAPLGTQVAVPPARARRHRRACTPTRASS